MSVLTFRNVDVVSVVILCAVQWILTRELAEIYDSPVWGDGEEEKVTLKGPEMGGVGKRSCYL